MYIRTCGWIVGALLVSLPAGVNAQQFNNIEYQRQQAQQVINHRYYESSQAQPAQTSVQGLTMKRTWYRPWGAFARDPDKASLGIGGARSTATTREEAEEEAIAGCRRTGGGDGCRVFFIFRNECAALSVGMVEGGQARLFPSKASRQETATRKSLEACGAEATLCNALDAVCLVKSFYLDGWE